MRKIIVIENVPYKQIVPLAVLELSGVFDFGTVMTKAKELYPGMANFFKGAQVSKVLSEMVRAGELNEVEALKGKRTLYSNVSPRMKMMNQRRRQSLQKLLTNAS
jgi:hypothetical protein